MHQKRPKTDSKFKRNISLTILKLPESFQMDPKLTKKWTQNPYWIFLFVSLENSIAGQHNELSNENKDFEISQKAVVLSSNIHEDKAKRPKTNEDFFSSFDANIKLVKSNTRKVIKDMKLEKNTNT